MDAARIELKLVLGEAGIDDPNLNTFSERFNIQKRFYLIQVNGYDLGYRFGCGRRAVTSCALPKAKVAHGTFVNQASSEVDAVARQVVRSVRGADAGSLGVNASIGNLVYWIFPSRSARVLPSNLQTTTPPWPPLRRGGDMKEVPAWPARVHPGRSNSLRIGVPASARPSGGLRRPVRLGALCGAIFVRSSFICVHFRPSAAQIRFVFFRPSPCRPLRPLRLEIVLLHFSPTLLRPRGLTESSLRRTGVSSASGGLDPRLMAFDPSRGRP
jgi:hypothetical protein